MEIKNNRNLNSETGINCHSNCLTCIYEGNNIDNQCTKCKVNFHFKYGSTTTCEKDDNTCPIGCVKCHKNQETDLGEISSDKQCIICKIAENYYPLEKYKEDQFYVICHLNILPLKNYFF